MSFTAREILDVLDAHAKKFDFPGFDNMNYDTVDARLHAFRDDARWAIVIEELVDWPSMAGPVSLVFTMGTGAKSKKPFGQPVDPFDLPKGEKMGGEEDVLPARVLVRGRDVEVDEGAVTALARAHGTANGFALLVWLVERHRDDLFRTQAELSKLVKPGLPEILRLDGWHHPHVYGGVKPSESEAFRQIAEVLATGDASKYAPSEPPNSRDWKKWLDK